MNAQERLAFRLSKVCMVEIYFDGPVTQEAVEILRSHLALSQHAYPVVATADDHNSSPRRGALTGSSGQSASSPTGPTNKAPPACRSAPAATARQHEVLRRRMREVPSGNRHGDGRRSGRITFRRLSVLRRTHDPARDACQDAGVAFFHKQSAHRFNERGQELDGEMIQEYPN